ncbi:MAG TPA: hypothetical protein VF837_02895 [Patescibacteria group bacterium]
MSVLARAALFLTWPIVLPLKTIPEDLKNMGLTYLAGFAMGILAMLLIPASLQLFVFAGLAVITGLLWGHWIAEGREQSDLFGRTVSTFVAGMLLVFGIHLFFSIFHVYLFARII